ncbi:MAG: acyl-CoA thioesterase [Pseudomonadota bacterium]
MTPDMVNFSGTIHGGHILLLLDQTAYACAVRYCRHNVVTLSVDQVLFKQPIYAGELVSFYANVNYVGKTSMEVGIRVVAENLKTRTQRHVMTCYFTMVAVDDHMKPCAVEPLILRTEEDKRWCQEAEVRKAVRMEAAAQHKKLKK